MQQHAPIQNENQITQPKPSSSLLKETVTGSLGSKMNELPSSGIRLERSASLRSSLRPLGASNRPEEGEFKRPGARLPKKNTTVISKAMEYMFGW